MNIAEWSIRNSVITWVLTVLMVVVGVISFGQLSLLEDPEFTIKEAVIITPYPGASAAEVEQEVTNVIEQAVQALGQLDYVESRSARGLSVVKAVIKSNYDKSSLPQVWDELRRKVGDVALMGQLPPGAGPSIVNDDFGDVYGVYVAITGEGYSYQEIYEYAKFLKRELLQVSDVKRIIIYANQPEAIYVEMQREKMSQFGISPEQIYASLQARNLPASSGNLTLGQEFIPVNPTGEFQSEEEFGNLLVGTAGDGTLVYLRDVAEIRREYQEPAETLLRFDGVPAVGLAVATSEGGNVVRMGQALGERYQQLQSQAPLGMDGHIVSLQSDAVVVSIRGFLVSLAQAVAIVVVVLLFFMGLRSGLIIGSVLLVTILGTFIFMNAWDVTLQRISLGALVIALGMLVDNAIVVTDGIRVKLNQGIDAVKAAKDVVAQTSVPLLGATIVAITAFASIGTSDDSTGEYTATLFYVILISLLLSWVTAVSSTPLLCKTFLKPAKASADGEQKDPYGGAFYRVYRTFLSMCIRFRWMTLGVVVMIFIAAVLGFGAVKQSFFPDSTRPQFYVDFWLPEGTGIEETSRQMTIAEEDLSARDGVTHITTQIGGGSPRFLLTYSPESNYRSFGRILIDVDDHRRIPVMAKEVQRDMEALFPQAIVQVRQFVLGPSTGGKIQLRISGPDPDVLRQLAAKAEDVLLSDPETQYVRNEWREKVKVVRPQFADLPASRLGVDRPALAQAIETAVEGSRVGVYRERDELLPIISRAPADERVDLDNLGSIQVWSPAANQMVPIDQVVSGFDVEFEDANLWRRNRTSMLKLHADPRSELPSQLLSRVKPEVERALNVDVAQITGRAVADGEDPFANHTANTLRVGDADIWPLKGMPGYYMAWGGDAEGSARAGAALASTLPVFFGLMVLIVLMLFNSIRKTLVIWLTVPLAIIGVTAGLLLFKQPFGFMALLGLMSLSGMLIKNAIVLIDEIDAQQASGKSAFQAILDSGVSRLIPVSMAASTTILGLIPLLQDAFFIAMAVTIMFGLGFATVLTLVVVPVLYAVFFRVPHEQPT
jgi:multidrug efflux pump subunit AcrB